MKKKWTQEDENELNLNREVFKKELKNLLKYREVRFRGRSLKNLSSPCVYIYLLCNEPLYIGMSKIGLQRTLTPKQNISASKLIEESDELIIYPMDTEIEARRAEKLLIRDLLPKYNRI